MDVVKLWHIKEEEMEELKVQIGSFRQQETRLVAIAERNSWLKAYNWESSMESGTGDHLIVSCPELLKTGSPIIDK